MLDGLLQAGVLRAAARQRDAVGGAGLLGHDEAALGHGHLDTRGDLVHGLALTHQGDDLGLGEHRALGGDGDHVPGRQGQVGELRQAHLKAAGHGLVEAAGTGGALIVHREALDRAVGVDADALNVLAADIDDGAVLSEHDLRPLGHVARGDLDHDNIALLRGLADVLLREVHDDLIIEAAQGGMMGGDGVAHTVGIENVDELAVGMVDHHAQHFAANITGSTDAGIMDHVCFPPC